MAKLLIIEDDKVIGRELKVRLSHENHIVDLCENGTDGVYRLENYDYDLAIVDWNLPDIEGVEICSRIRKVKPELPLLMLTSRAALDDRIEGLDAGAMDYLVKPCDLIELSARIRALLRRHDRQSNSSLALLFADINLNPATREAKVNGRELKLAPREFDLLALLMVNTDRMLNMKKIAGEMGKEYDDSVHNTLKQCVLTLRRKLEEAKSKTSIEFQRDNGYRLVDEGRAAESEQ